MPGNFEGPSSDFCKWAVNMFSFRVGLNARSGRMVSKGIIVALIGLVVLVGCEKRPVYTPPGGFYNGDNLPDETPPNTDLTKDAVVKDEPLSKGGNRTYTVRGKTYHPLESSKGFEQEGMASWYGKKFHGRQTSSGEVYDMWAMSAAHTTLPLPTYVEVTHVGNGKKVIVKVNDRGPFLHNRIIDLSYAAAVKLDIVKQGTAKVRIRALDPKTYKNTNRDPAESIQNTATTPANPAPVNHSGGSGTLTDGVSYFVQVGAYAVLKNALNMRTILKSAGFPLFPEFDKDQEAAGLPYRVRVGPFKNVQKAQQVKTRLEQQFNEKMTLIYY